MHQAPLTHIRHWNWPARPLFRSPLQPANTALGSDPITGTGSTSQLVGLHLRNPSLMDHYSFNRPRRDGWLSWPCWLTDSICFTHKVVARPAISLAQDRESSPARTGGLTTMLCNQLWLLLLRYLSSCRLIILLLWWLLLLLLLLLINNFKYWKMSENVSWIWSRHDKMPIFGSVCLAEVCRHWRLHHSVSVHGTVTSHFRQMPSLFLFSVIFLKSYVSRCCLKSVTVTAVLFVLRLRWWKLPLTKPVLPWKDAWSLWTRTETCLWRKFACTALRARPSNSVSCDSLFMITVLWLPMYIRTDTQCTLIGLSRRWTVLSPISVLSFHLKPCLSES